MSKLMNADSARLAEEVMTDGSIAYGVDLWEQGASSNPSDEGFLHVPCDSKAGATELLDALRNCGAIMQAAPSVSRSHC